MFRPNFIEPENMTILGFELVKDKDNYMTYHNNATVHYNKDYNKKFPEPKGKVILHVNCNYHEDYFYLCIEQDGGTRNSFCGVCNTESFLKELLSMVR